MKSGHIFSKKTIKSHTPLVKQTLIKGAKLQKMITADQLLTHTQEYCQQLTINSQAQIQAAIQQASQQVLQRADQLLSHLQEQQQQLLQASLPKIRELLYQAAKQLMLTLPEQQVIDMLLKQLIANDGSQSTARLFCSSQQYQTINDWFSQNDIQGWQLKIDHTLDTNTLRLEDLSGCYTASIELSLAALAATLRPSS